MAHQGLDWRKRDRASTASCGSRAGSPPRGGVRRAARPVVLLCIAALAPAAASQTADDLLRRGAMLQQQGDTDGAIETLQEAASEAPDRLDVLTQLSASYLRAGRPSQAVESLRRAKDLAPRHPGVAYFLGLAHFQSGQPQEAVPELELILEQQPSNSQALHLYGVCLLKLGDLEGGIEALEHALTVNPGIPQAVYTLGSAYIKAGRVDRAKKLVSMRLENDEGPEALLVKGSVHLAEKRYGDALARLERARDANPGLPMVHSQIGVALLYEGRRDRAEREFRAELGINPLDFNANAFLGWLLQQKGESEEAIRLLDAAHDLQESDTGVKYLQAQSHSARGEWEAAAGLLEAVTRAQPEFNPAHVMLARAYAKLKRTGMFRRQQAIIRRLNEQQQERDLRGVDRLYDGTVLALPAK